MFHNQIICILLEDFWGTEFVRLEVIWKKYDECGFETSLNVDNICGEATSNK